MRFPILLLLSIPAFAQCDFSGKSYDMKLKPGEFHPVCHFKFANHGNGVMAGLEIDTDSDVVDTAAAIRIENSGRSDAIWIGLKGKAQKSTPTGIGIDVNRGAGDHENSSQMNGLALQIYDWSETDQGLDGPQGIFIQKVHNLNSQHRLLHLRTNRSAITLETPEGPGYNGGEVLIDVTNGRVQKFRLSADGSMGWGAGTVIHSSSSVAQYVGSITTSNAQQDLLKVYAGHCQAQPTNQQAASLSQWVEIANGAVVLHHRATAGAKFDVFCTAH